MSQIFHHHPGGWIIIQAGKHQYTDTLENFMVDYAHAYPGLPDGITEFRYAADGPTYYISDKNVQIASDMDIDFVLGAIQNIHQIIANQEQRLTQTEKELDPDYGKQANEGDLKQIALSIGIDTSSSIWRDDLLLKIAQAVFKSS